MSQRFQSVYVFLNKVLTLDDGLSVGFMCFAVAGTSDHILNVALSAADGVWSLFMPTTFTSAKKVRTAPF